MAFIPFQRFLLALFVGSAIAGATVVPRGDNRKASAIESTSVDRIALDLMAMSSTDNKRFVKRRAPPSKATSVEVQITTSFIQRAIDIATECAAIVKESRFINALKQGPKISPCLAKIAIELPQATSVITGTRPFCDRSAITVVNVLRTFTDVNSRLASLLIDKHPILLLWARDIRSALVNNKSVLDALGFALTKAMTTRSDEAAEAKGTWDSSLTGAVQVFT